MYECRHFFEDDCERLPTSLKVKPELLVNAHDATEHILSVKVPIVRTRGIASCYRKDPRLRYSVCGEAWQERERSGHRLKLDGRFVCN